MKAILKHLNIQLLKEGEKGKAVTLLVVNNPDGSPRWICNSKSKKPHFLKFYLVNSIKSKLVAKGIKLIFFFRLQKLIFKTVKIKFKSLDDSKTPTINILKHNWAIFTGTVGPNNKIVVYEKSEKYNQFYKVAVSQKSTSLIKKEALVLAKLKHLEPFSFTYPFANKIHENTLRLGDVSFKGKRTKEFGFLHKTVLDQLYAKVSKTAEISNLPIFNLCLLKLHQLEECEDKRIPRGILKKLRVMLDAMREKVIHVGLCHGDFTPWNMYVHNGKLAIYDWEHANDSMPIGFDAFHYIIQNGILVKRQSWKKIRKEIKQKITPRVFHNWSKKAMCSIEEYMGFYLTINSILCLSLYAEQKKWHTQIDWLLNTWNDALSDLLKINRADRELVIMDLFDVIHNKNYAAIGFPNIAPEKLSEFSDIDLCIEKDDLKSLTKYLKNHSLTKHIFIVRKSFMATVQVFMKDGGFLSLDVMWQFKRKSFVMLNAAEVLSRSYQNLFHIKQVSLLDKVRYIGLFYGLNHSKIPSKYKGYQQILSKEENRLDEILYCSYLDNSILKRLLIKCLKKETENKYFHRIKNVLTYYLDSLRLLLFSKGMVITFSGVDGAGKSTVIENIKFKIEKKIRKRVVVLRHRPSLLPILSVWLKGKEKASKEVLESLPRQGGNKNYISSFLRFSYYYMDYFFGQFYVYFKYVSRGYVVLYDRYYFDFINDSRRSNIQLPNLLVKAGYKFLLKPDLNFFLYAKSKTILKRKKELSARTIKELNKGYLALFNDLSLVSDKQYFTIENNELKQTLGFVINETTQKLGQIS